MKKRVLILGMCVPVLLGLAFVLRAYNAYTPAPPVEALRSLPYATWVPAENTLDKKGVTRYDRERAFNGINIYNPRHLPEAWLMDMSGRILHKWSKKTDGVNQWYHTKLFPNGDLLVLIKDEMLFRLDWDSNIKWMRRMRFHHDVGIAANGDIYALTRRDKLILHKWLPLPILNDYITVLSPEGKIKEHIPLHGMLKDNIRPVRVYKIYRDFTKPRVVMEMIKRKIKKGFFFSFCDLAYVLHTNTVSPAGRDIEGVCGEGDLLICPRDLHMIGIVDIGRKELIWEYKKMGLEGPHDPTFLDNGNILIFDNGTRRKYSRLLEIDPRTKETVWEYTADPPEDFFTETRGGAQRLPNGNTLVTETHGGRVFEITAAGEVVWEYYIPILDFYNMRAVTCRMFRITDPGNYPCLKRLERSAHEEKNIPF